MITRPVTSDVVLDMASTTGPWGPLPPNYGTTFLSAAYEAANRTAYYPFFIPVTCTVKRLWWANGTDTTGGATIAAAMYHDAGYKPGARITNSNGSAVQGTASQVQFISPAGDFVLSPGLKWFALASTSATNTTLLAINLLTGSFDASIRYNEALGTPPATANPVEGTGNLWLCGFSTTTLT